MPPQVDTDDKIFTTTTTDSGLMVASDGSFALPVVDFTPFLTEMGGVPTEGQIRAAQALDEACREYGFVCLRNSGIPKELVAQSFQASQDLFSGSPEDKEKLKKLDPVLNIGYCGFGHEALNRRRGPDLKECFNVRNPQKEGYPGYQGTTPEFQDATSIFWNEIGTLSDRFAKCCAIALGLDTEYFSSTLSSMDLCTMRSLHYPPCPADVSDETNAGSAIRVGEHTDFGLYTFLFVHDAHDKSSLGLQMKSIQGADLGCASNVQRDDEVFVTGWKDVVFADSVLETLEKDETSWALVNTGALMARWTNDVWRATAHRVVVHPEAREHDRYSIACFVDPDASTLCTVHPKFVPEGEEPKYPPITSAEYLKMKLGEAQGVSSNHKKEG
eukprot:Nitzschia sp. Nitz4//scaffold97_size77645//51641//52798//NITZ4_005523-RA/size77645-processed-gene-0.44-mRNA-1//1//CDS//3329560671//2342//frame0